MSEEAEPVTPVERAHEEEEQEEEEEVSQTHPEGDEEEAPFDEQEARVPLPLLRGCTYEVPRASLLFRFLTAAQ